MDATLLDKIAAAQAGLFTRTQAHACGFSGPQIRRRVRSGLWQQVLGPVFGRAGLIVTVQLRDRATFLAVRRAVLAGPSAARFWGLDVPDSRCCLAVEPNQHRRMEGAVLLRGRLDDGDIELIGGVLVTSRARTVFDCLRLLPQEQALDLLDRAVRERWLTFEELTDRVRAFVGSHGAPRMVRLVQVAASGAQSHAERLAVALIRRVGLKGWTANNEIHDEAGLIGVGDIVFDDVKLVVEIDGWAFHNDRTTFQRDRTRQNRLITAGWTPLRFTWRDLTDRPEHVVATIRATLVRLAAPPTTR